MRTMRAAMHQNGPLVAALAGVLGVTSLAYIAEIELVRDLLAGFGLGVLIGTVVGLTRTRLGHGSDLAYTVNGAGLIGACIALVLYGAAELL
jgi:hypothetical protein